MVTLRLVGVHFFSYHGIYPIEKVTGNDFYVNMEVSFNEHGEDITSIDQTISYEHLFHILKARMDIPTPLLETIAIEVGKEIHEKYPAVKSIHIDITKQRPPIEGLNGAVGVSWNKEY
jgi:7,8-dihydroneopterin aldolase/epimerase/oxygenase